MENYQFYYSVMQMGTFFAEMSSWTALTWFTVTKTTFKTKNMKSDSFGIFIIKFLDFKSNLRKCFFFKEIQPITTRSS